MTVRYLSIAEVELADILQWYEDQQPGLASRLLDEVEKAVARIQRNPEAWRPIGREHRRIMIHIFKIGLIYRFKMDEIVISQIIDLRSDPESWRDNLENR